MSVFDEIDRLEEVAANLLFVQKIPPARAIRAVARSHPSVPAMMISLVFVGLADAHQRLLQVSDTDEQAIPAQVYKAVAILALDIWALECSGQAHPKAADLLPFWGAEEAYFMQPDKGRA